MKKIACAFICSLCLLAAAPVYAQNSDIEAATKVVEASIEASKKGDVPATLDLCSKKFKAELESYLAEYENLEEFAVLIAKNTDEKINSIQTQGANIEAVIHSYGPDMSALMEKALTEIMQETIAGKLKINDMTDEEFGKLVLSRAITLFLKDDYVMINTKHTVTLVKEDGQWKIDDTADPEQL